MGDGEQCKEYFYGQTLKTRRVANFVLAERSYPPRCSAPSHVHAHPLYCLVLSGIYHTTFHGKTMPCAPSALIFHAARQSHIVHFEDTGGRLLTVEIDPSWFIEMDDFSMMWTENTAMIEEHAFGQLGMKLYREFLHGDDASKLIIEGILLELTGLFSRAWQASTPHSSSALPPQWLREARESIQTDFARTWSLSSLAKAAGVHPVHFAQTFRRFYDCTVGDYIRNLRIEFACQELIDTEMPLVDVAMCAGFSDQSHFARTFKQIVGVPPSQYRNSARKERAPRPNKHSAVYLSTG